LRHVCDPFNYSLDWITVEMPPDKTEDRLPIRQVKKQTE
jgi:hypothetical protein